MPEKRRKFSPQFKAEAVQMVIDREAGRGSRPGIWVSMTGRWAMGGTVARCQP
jgi:transposase-like protein